MFALTDILRGCTEPGDDLAFGVALILEDVATAEAIAAIADAVERDLL